MIKHSHHLNLLLKFSTLQQLSVSMMVELYKIHKPTLLSKKLIIIHHLLVPKLWPILLLNSQLFSFSYFMLFPSSGLMLLSNPYKLYNLHFSMLPSTHQYLLYFITILLSSNDHYSNSCQISSLHSYNRVNHIILHHKK